MDQYTGETPPQSDPPRRARFAGLGRRGATALTAVGLLTGGLAGGYIVSNAATSSSSSTATNSSGTSSNGSSSATTTPSNGSSTGTFHPNEDPTHEAGESAQREAQENAGQFPTVP